MKFVLLSDPHLLLDKPKSRMDDAVQAAWDKFAWVYNFAYEEEATVLISGDLTDGPRSWQVLPDITNFYGMVSAWPHWRGEHTYVVRGQHDTYMRNTNMNKRTIMGVLAEAGFVTELSGDPIVLNDNKVALYGSNWGDNIGNEHFKWPCQQGVTNILVIHAPISDQSLWEGQDYLHAERFIKNTPYKLVLCGDIHRTFAIKHEDRWICNTGPMIRKEASLYNFSHRPCVFLYDTASNKLELVVIPHEPAEGVLNRDHIERDQARQKSTMDMSQFVEKVKAARSGTYKATTFKDNLTQLLSAGKASAPVINLLREVTKCQLQVAPHKAQQQRIKS